MVLTLFGLNHRSSSVSQRERLCFEQPDEALFLKALADTTQVSECVLVSTCNRFELFVIHESGFDAAMRILQLLKEYRGYLHNESEGSYYVHHDIEAVRHLFRVASGIDSMILGENQIAGQLRQAYSRAVEQKTNGPLTNRIFHAAFRVAKRVRSETGISRGAGSVGYAAVEYAAAVHPDLDTRTVLLVGAGKIAQIAAKNLSEKKVQRIIVTNRTEEKAKELAVLLNGESRGIEGLPSLLAESDIVICSTSAGKHIITRDMMEDVMRHRKGAPILLVDIAMPRDCDPVIREMTGVTLVNLDDLKDKTGDNLKKRETELPAVHSIIEEEAAGFDEWKLASRLAPLISEMKQSFEEVRMREISRVAASCSPEIASALEEFSVQLVDKMMQVPVLQMKKDHAGCARCRSDRAVANTSNTNEERNDDEHHCRQQRK